MAQSHETLPEDDPSVWEMSKQGLYEFPNISGKGIAIGIPFHLANDPGVMEAVTESVERHQATSDYHAPNPRNVSYGSPENFFSTLGIPPSEEVASIAIRHLGNVYKNGEPAGAQTKDGTLIFIASTQTDSTLT